MPDLPLLRENYARRHGSCVVRRLDRNMDATLLKSNANPELEAELETWDWVRAAGVSAEDLRLALQALLPGPELRKAA
jgi:hypothetical protein